ncbi:MAG: hypothetical protein IT289_05010 [Oligoflexia bacterium]|nr:hypothetical protein [Oligoflexia bacterium]
MMRTCKSVTSVMLVFTFLANLTFFSHQASAQSGKVIGDFDPAIPGRILVQQGKVGGVQFIWCVSAADGKSCATHEFLGCRGASDYQYAELRYFRKILHWEGAGVIAVDLALIYVFALLAGKIVAGGAAAKAAAASPVVAEGISKVQPVVSALKSNVQWISYFSLFGLSFQTTITRYAHELHPLKRIDQARAIRPEVYEFHDINGKMLTNLADFRKDLNTALCGLDEHMR